MRTSQTFSLSEPTGADRVPEGVFAYLRTRHRYRVHSLVLGEFARSGITQADLARRLGKGTDIVCRWLGSPGNWTLDTLSDLLFAVSGAEPDYNVKHPLRAASQAQVDTSGTAGQAKPDTQEPKVYSTDYDPLPLAA